MILTLNQQELDELQKHGTGPYGEDNVHSFLAEICARINEETGEVDLDREHFDRIQAYSDRGCKERLDKIFKRAMDKALGEFFG